MMLQLLSLFLKSHLKRMSPLLGETFSLLTTVVIFGLRLLPNLVLGFLVVDLVVDLVVGLVVGLVVVVVGLVVLLVNTGAGASVEVVCLLSGGWKGREELLALESEVWTREEQFGDENTDRRVPGTGESRRTLHYTQSRPTRQCTSLPG